MSKALWFLSFGLFHYIGCILCGVFHVFTTPKVSVRTELCQFTILRVHRHKRRESMTLQHQVLTLSDHRPSKDTTCAIILDIHDIGHNSSFRWGGRSDSLLSGRKVTTFSCADSRTDESRGRETSSCFHLLAPFDLRGITASLESTDLATSLHLPKHALTGLTVHGRSKYRCLIRC